MRNIICLFYGWFIASGTAIGGAPTYVVFLSGAAATAWALSYSRTT